LHVQPLRCWCYISVDELFAKLIFFLSNAFGSRLVISLLAASIISVFES